MNRSLLLFALAHILEAAYMLLLFNSNKTAFESLIKHDQILGSASNCNLLGKLKRHCCNMKHLQSYKSVLLRIQKFQIHITKNTNFSDLLRHYSFDNIPAAVSNQIRKIKGL